MNKHMVAINGGTVTKTSVIGIRKAINHVERLRAGYSGNRSNATPAEVDAIEAALLRREPIVTGELHDSGLKVLRNPRYAKRFDSAQRAIIEASDAFFQLVRFDRVDNGMHAVPVYRIIAKGGNFLFRNVSWQTALRAFALANGLLVGPLAHYAAMYPRLVDYDGRGLALWEVCPGLFNATRSPEDEPKPVSNPPQWAGYSDLAALKSLKNWRGGTL